MRPRVVFHEYYSPTESRIDKIYAILVVISFLSVMLAWVMLLEAVNRLCREGRRQSKKQNMTPDVISEFEEFNAKRLLNIGLDEDNVRDHPKLGFFYDPIKLQVADHPVVLNTGDIVDRTTAACLVKNQSNLPRGKVTRFFESSALERLCETLIDEATQSKQLERKSL